MVYTFNAKNYMKIFHMKKSHILEWYHNKFDKIGLKLSRSFIEETVFRWVELIYLCGCQRIFTIKTN